MMVFHLYSGSVKHRGCMKMRMDMGLIEDWPFMRLAALSGQLPASSPRIPRNKKQQMCFPTP